MSTAWPVLERIDRLDAFPGEWEEESSRSVTSSPAKTHRRPSRRNGSDEVVQVAD
jgi:hypothetical protein